MYEFSYEGWEELQRYLVNFPQISQRELKAAMQKSVVTIAREVKPLTPVGVSGELRSSIGSEVIQEGPTSIVGRVGSSITEAYPVVMEAGARPHFPPPGNLMLWVKRKQITGVYSTKTHRRLGSKANQFWEDVGAAFMVARAISHHGIKGRFFMKKGWEQSQARVNAFFEIALINIVSAIRRGA